MPLPTERNQYPFDKSGTYRIHLVGYVNESWSDRLGGMRIEEKSQEDQGSTTTLVGRIRDQAELMGVLNTLYELHLTLVSVEHLNDL